jgi:hypothetical protein
MAFTGPNTSFKRTSSKARRLLRALGYNYIQVYNRLLSFKLKEVTFNFTVTALSTKTTIGNQYTTPDGLILTVITTGLVGDTNMRMSAGPGTPDAGPSTLTLVAGSSGTLGTAQASIAYSAVFTTPGSLGPIELKE